MFLVDGKYDADRHHNSHSGRRRPGHGRRTPHGLEGSREAAVASSRRTGDQARPRRLSDLRRARALAGRRPRQHEAVSGLDGAVLEEGRAVRGRRDSEATRSCADAPADRGTRSGRLLQRGDRRARRKGNDVARRVDDAPGPRGVQAKKRGADSRHLPRLRRAVDAADQLGRRRAGPDAQHPRGLRSEGQRLRIGPDDSSRRRIDAPRLRRSRPAPRRSRLQPAHAGRTVDVEGVRRLGQVHHQSRARVDIFARRRSRGRRKETRRRMSRWSTSSATRCR